MRPLLLPACVLLLTACATRASLEPSDPAGPIPVEIVRTDDGGFQLLRGGQPYFVKGAVAIDRHLDELVAAGANSVRTRGDRAFLDRLHALGLSVLFNLPVRAERSGMDYDDAVAVREQFEAVMTVVREYRDHPAILFWALGNELDHIPGNHEPNWKVFDALGELTRAIHAEDPHHPVMTVMGMGHDHKLGELRRRAPELDLIGVNAYGDIGRVRGWVDEYGWDRPYVFTEWGPTGAWQVPKTSWRRPIEETESEKADVRRRRYEEAVLAHPDRVLGSYIFHWWSRQETTHTWYGMFDEGGRASESVDAMQYVWTGAWPENRAPRLVSLQIEGRGAHDSVELEAGRSYRAVAVVEDPEGDPLEYAWELVREPDQYGAYAGGGEIRQPAVPGTVPLDQNSPEITFTAPQEPGEYRLFLYAYDGRGHFTAANIPLDVN
jgi:hypothetical protein